jgi:hypothetical protein
LTSAPTDAGLPTSAGNRRLCDIPPARLPVARLGSAESGTSNSLKFEQIWKNPVHLVAIECGEIPPLTAVYPLFITAFYYLFMPRA